MVVVSQLSSAVLG